MQLLQVFFVFVFPLYHRVKYVYPLNNDCILMNSNNFYGLNDYWGEHEVQILMSNELRMV